VKVHTCAGGAEEARKYQNASIYGCGLLIMYIVLQITKTCLVDEPSEIK
jgi:hypothetical protein